MNWIADGGIRSAAIWGLVLGNGLMTYIEFPAFLVLLAWILAQGDVVVGAIVGATYGFARSLTALSSWVSSLRDGTPADPSKLVGTRLIWHPVNGIMLLILAVSVAI